MIGKGVIVTLLFLILVLNIKVFSQDGGLREAKKLKSTIATQQVEIDALTERNMALAKKIELFKEDEQAVEELARNELGMIKRNETYYQVVEPIK